MSINHSIYNQILEELDGKSTLVAVSKTKPVADVTALYDLGQKDFGENYVQELLEKQPQLPPDIRWHYIGHLQTNKVKYIAPFVHLIHGVDSFKLLKEINKQGQKSNRVVACLLQMHIAREETKFGLDEKELEAILSSSELAGLKNIRIRGLMGMASFTNDLVVVRNEFRELKVIFDKYRTGGGFDCLSMGMSADYKLAVEEGSTMVRIGSLIFGERS
jgi:PLP dependent protein